MYFRLLISSDSKRVSFSQIVSPFSLSLGKMNSDCYCLRMTQQILCFYRHLRLYVTALSTLRIYNRTHRDDKKYKSQQQNFVEKLAAFLIPHFRLSNRIATKRFHPGSQCSSFALAIESFFIIFVSLDAFNAITLRNAQCTLYVDVRTVSPFFLIVLVN
jgi:hypothetical protein